MMEEYKGWLKCTKGLWHRRGWIIRDKNAIDAFEIHTKILTQEMADKSEGGLLSKYSPKKEQGDE